MLKVKELIVELDTTAHKYTECFVEFELIALIVRSSKAIIHKYMLYEIVRLDITLK